MRRGVFTAMPPMLRCRALTWTRDVCGLSGPSPAPSPPSNYLTLIPLSDARLQPRDTRLTVISLLAFAIVIGAAVFVAVPRGIYFGEVFIRPDHMSWNTTRSTYQLKLLARVPVYNPNYLKVPKVSRSGGMVAALAV